MNITRENSDDLGFVLAALTCQAITMPEFSEWVSFVIENFDYPEEFLDLWEAEYVTDVFRTLRFTPTLADHQDVGIALYGIAYSRFGRLFEAPVSRIEAREALSRRDDVRRRFWETFPFLKEPEEE